MTAEEAVAQAKVENLTLLRSGTVSGFKNATFNNGRVKPYQTHVTRGGKKVHLGHFATAQEAALCFARTPEGRAAAAAPASAEEAVRQAEAEGLTLLRSDIGSSGYQGVAFRSGDTKPYQVQVQRGGKRVYLGAFATAEAAALCYARSVRPSDAKAVPSVSGDFSPTKRSRRQVVAAAPETLLKAERRQK